MRAFLRQPKGTATMLSGNSAVKKKGGEEAARREFGKLFEKFSRPGC
jgi:hypothetical protein